MDAVGKRNNNQYAGAKTTTHFDGSPTQAQGEGRRFRKKVRHKNNAGCAYEDRQGRKVDWQAVAPFFKRIFPRPPAEAWGSGLRVADNQVSDPIWVGTDKECVTKNEYGQILQYLQNKCNIYDLELSRPDEGHDSFINSITEEIVAVSLRSLSDATPRSSRATKLLINFGNNAAWVVFDRVGPGVPKLEEQNHPAQLCISSYVALSPSEYEYILNLFQYVALARGAVPISAVPIIGKLEEPEESQALDGTEDTEDTISLGGFVWQKSPRALASAPGASGPSSAAVLEGLLDRYSLRCAVQTDEAMPDLGEDDSFTGRQIISSLYELMAVETELHEMRERILSQMCVENIYPYRLSHEPRIAQFITAKARASQRWSQFRRTIIAAVNHYACQMLEARRNAPETAAPPEADAVLGSEYCSVCLMAEQAHKHVLMQCRRCRVRVHHQCYASISQGPPVDGGPWLCDVCSEEGGRGDSYVSNRGICAICGSSGGAMKRVDGEAAVYFTQFYAAQYGGACGNDGKTPGACWIHIICGAWLIPSVNCKDWLTLSNWDITNLRTSPKNNRCAVCMAALGFYVSCRIPQCGVKMHPLCAWLGGVFVTVKFVYSKSLPFNNAADNCFTPFQIEPLCPFHSCKEFSQE